MKNDKRIKVVVDTNIFVSGIIVPQGTSFELLEVWRRKEYILLISEVLLKELENVLRRPKFIKYHLTEEKINGLLQLIIKKSIKVSPSPTFSATIRDPKDEMILSTALDGNADYLITGDKDLLVLNGNPQLGKLKIVTANDFLKIISVKP